MLIIIVCFLNFVYASDSINNTTDVVDKVDSSSNNHQLQNGDESTSHVVSEKSKNIKASTYSVNNYDQLYDTLNSKNTTEKSVVINLQSNKTYNLNKTILLDSKSSINTVIINGNGHILDAGNKSVFMNISYGKTVNITNLTIKNTNYNKASTFSNNGTLNLINCTFIDNSVKQWGLVFNRATLTIDKCNIQSNIDDADEFILTNSNAKGIVTNYGACYITNSNISNIASSSASFVDNYGYLYLNKIVMNNSVSDFGSIISHIYSITVIENSIFSNSISTYAGVISNHGILTLKSNKFESNTASIGGVLYNNGNVSFIGNVLVNNEAALGGVIYNEMFTDKNTNESYGYINCKNNTFTHNTASIGAIISNNGNISFVNNIVNNNYASNSSTFSSDNKKSGTAIIENNAQMNITNNKFDSNYAVYTGILHNKANVSFVNNNLTNNYVINNNSFIIENYAQINITKCYFNNNTNNYRDMLIYSSNNKYNISNNIYLNNRLNNTIKATYKNNTVYVNITLRSIYNSTVYNGSIVLYSNGHENNIATVINATSKVDVLTKNVFKNNNNMTIQFVSLEKHYLNTTYNFKYDSNFTTYLTIKPIATVTAGDMFVINATILDKNNNLINEGYVIFKYNSLTIKDNNSNTLKVNVVNGSASFKYAIQNNTKTSNATIEVVYSGSGTKYIETRVVTSFSIINKATIVVTLNQSTVKMDQQIKFIATVKRDGKAINHGFVIFKINGVTVKDSNGNQVRCYLKNGVASHDFTIPDGWSAKANKLTAVYSELTYTRLENKTYFSINRTDMHFNVTNITGIKNKTATISGQLLDDYNHSVLGISAVAIKIDGKTYSKVNGSTQYFAVVNGTILINFKIPENISSGNHTIELVTGTRNAYVGTRSQIILTVS